MVCSFSVAPSNCVCGSTVNSWLRGKSKATTQQTDHCLDSHAHGSWCCPNPRKFSSSLRIPFSGVRKSETRALRYERSSAWSSPTHRSRPCHWPASLKPVLRRPPNQRPGRAGGSCARGSTARIRRPAQVLPDGCRSRRRSPSRWLADPFRVDRSVRSSSKGGRRLRSHRQRGAAAARRPRSPCSTAT